MINEFVLLYGDEAGATRAVADNRDQIEACAQPMSEIGDYPAQTSLIEKGFDAWREGVERPVVSVARNGTVVVVVESNGWADRTSRTMTFAMVRVVMNERERFPSLLDDTGRPDVPRSGRR